MGKRRNNGQHDAIVRIDEAINGPNGVLAEMHRLNSDLFSVKLVLVGGLDPATGKEKQGLAQSYGLHVQDHTKRERRNTWFFRSSVVILLGVIAEKVAEWAGLR